MTGASPQVTFRVHAVQRMAERGVTIDEVRAVLTQGETIEDYSNDAPYPASCSVGSAGDRSTLSRLSLRQPRR
jgi:hypothetical protein